MRPISELSDEELFSLANKPTASKFFVSEKSSLAEMSDDELVQIAENRGLVKRPKPAQPQATPPALVAQEAPPEDATEDRNIYGEDLTGGNIGSLLRVLQEPRAIAGTAWAGVKKGAYGSMQAISEGLSGDQPMGDAWRGAAKYWAGKYSEADREQKAATPDFGDDYVAKAMFGGVASAATNIPLALAALATRNPWVALGPMGVQSGGDKYGEMRQEGYSPGKSAGTAVLTAAAEVGPEFLPMGTLLRMHGAAGLKKLLFRYLGEELATEEVTTIAQSAIDWGAKKPEMTFSEWAATLPEAIRDTAISTLVAAPLTGGSVAGVSKAARYVEQKRVDKLLEMAGDQAPVAVAVAQGVRDVVRSDPEKYAPLATALATGNQQAAREVMAAMIAEDPGVQDEINDAIAARMPQAVQTQEEGQQKTEPASLIETEVDAIHDVVVAYKKSGETVDRLSAAAIEQAFLVGDDQMVQRLLTEWVQRRPEIADEIRALVAEKMQAVEKKQGEAAPVAEVEHTVPQEQTTPVEIATEPVQAEAPPVDQKVPQVATEQQQTAAGQDSETPQSEQGGKSPVVKNEKTPGKAEPLKPEEKAALRLTKLKGTSVIGEGITLIPEKIMTPQRRLEVKTKDSQGNATSFVRGGDIEVKTLAEVTGNPYDRGYVVIDRRARRLSRENKPIPADAVEPYGIKLPKGYRKEGNFYVYGEETKTQSATNQYAEMPQAEQEAQQETTAKAPQQTPEQKADRARSKQKFSERMTREMDREFGGGWTKRLFGTGRVHVISSDEVADIIGEDAIVTQGEDNVIQAFFNPKDQSTYLVHDAVLPDAPISKILQHEIGIHARHAGVGKAEWTRLTNQMQAMRETTPEVKAAYEAVPEGTPEDAIHEEAAAYLVENHPDLSVSQRIVAWFRNVIRSMARKLPAADRVAFVRWANELSPKDISYMARDALRTYPTMARDTGSFWEYQGSLAPKFSVSSWKNDKAEVERFAAAHGIPKRKAMAWLRSIDNVMARILQNPELDYDVEVEKLYSSLKNNSDPHYTYSLDFSTLCRKRYVLMATIEAIQREKGRALTKWEWVTLRTELRRRGYVVSCGACYVDSKRMGAGDRLNKWIKNKLKEDPEFDVQSVLSQKGLDRLKQTDPKTWASVNAVLTSENAKTTESRTDYRGEIRKLKRDLIDKMNERGGLRWQSWSDFEVVHLIDGMQAILDMSLMEMKGHAYTKVVDFVHAFGGTGMMINLSLIPKGMGFDADGKLIFDPVEGMDFDMAIALRDKFERTVGTIAIGVSNDHIRALLADPRIDYIIPYHASGLKGSIQFFQGMDGWVNYEKNQRERIKDFNLWWDKVGRNVPGLEKKKADYDKTPKDEKIAKRYKTSLKDAIGIDFKEWWSDSRTGQQNQKEYLRLCAERGLHPKFSEYRFADGRVLEDFTQNPNYWKLLIDRKMFDHRGNNIIQKAVQPKYDEAELQRIFDREIADPSPKMKPAQDVVDDWMAGKVPMLTEAQYKAEIKKMKDEARKKQLQEKIAAKKAAAEAKKAAKKGGIPVRFSVRPVHRGQDGNVYESPEAERYVNQKRMPLEGPELLDLYKEITGGKMPKLVERLRAAGALGEAQGDIVRLVKSVFSDPKKAMGVLAHEIGHVIDYLPDRIMKKDDSILAKIASLRGWKEDMLQAFPGGPDLLSEADFDRIKAEAEAAAVQPTQSVAIKPEDVVSIWNDLQGRENHPGLYDWVARLDARRKAELIKSAIRGVIPNWVNYRETIASAPADTRQAYLDAIAEEIRKRGLYEKAVIEAELQRLSMIWRPFDASANPRYTSYRHSSVELYADSISVLLNDPDLLLQIAPTYHRAFFSWLQEKPNIKQAYDSLQASLAIPGWKEKRRNQAIDRAWEAEEQKRKEEETPRPTAGLRYAIYKGLVERNAKLYEAVEEAQARGIATRPTDNPRYWAEELPYVDSTVFDYLREMDNRVITPLSEAGLDKVDMGKYLFFRRVATERKEIANPWNYTKDEALDMLEDLKNSIGDEEYAKLEQAATEFANIRNETVIQELRESKMFSKPLMDKIEDNDLYATFDVIMDMEQRYGGNTMAKIHAQTGTMMEIDNPLISTILKDMALIRASVTNSAKRSVVEMIEELYPGDKSELEKVDYQNGRIPEPKPVSGKGLLVFLDKGEVQAYIVNEEIAETFKRDPHWGNALAKGWRALNSALKQVLVSNNPFWVLWNIQRDVRTMILNTPGMGLTDAIKLWLEVLPDAKADVYDKESTPLVREAYQRRAIMINKWSDNEMEQEDTIDRRMFRFGVRDSKGDAHPLVRPLKYLWDQAGLLAQVSDRTTKLAGLKYKIDRGEDLKKAAHDVRSMIGTPDVMAGGKWRKIYNSIWLFSNVGTQGLRSSWAAYKQSKAEYIWKTLAYSLAPKLVMFSLAAGIGDELTKRLFGKKIKYKRMMENIPDRDKANLVTIPLYEQDNGKTVYLVSPLSFEGQVLGALLYQTGKIATSPSPEEVAQALDYFAGGLPYSGLNPLLGAGGAMLAYIFGKNPYDSFRGRYVIGEQEFKAGGLPAAEAMAKHLWNTLGGSSVIYRFPDERKGTENQSALEKVLGTPVLGVGLRRFVRVSDAGREDKLREIKRQVEKEQAKEILAIREAIIDDLSADKPQGAYATWAKLVKEGSVKRHTMDAFSETYKKATLYRIGTPEFRALFDAGSTELKAHIASQIMQWEKERKE